MRGQYDGYRDIDGVAPDSTTETYAAMRLEIDNWRWSGVPFFIRTGKHLPVTQTELRLVFKRPPRLGFHVAARARPSPTSSSSSSTRRPASGCCSRRSAATPASPEQISLDMEFAAEGGEGPAPYEVLLHAAMQGDSTRFTRQDGVEEAWRVHAAAARRAAAGAPLRQGHRGGRRRPTALSPATAAGTSPGSSS